ncbi:hypothetical protein J7373_04615 [Xanthomonas sp. A2111]|uniref:Uncharacterized protein n=1 Tax=Xanthomonas hawaiiensis TaxID=3003247 RepID=A0ABU2I8B2_9XANT|nr:hypothetical protein [Xanthomonas sp. A2111]MBO9827530.1 hypothetical protein [Xanthomonas sp. A2111]MDS9994380.1 hypothetical protein [Xanthomonas sp. A2111]
MAPISRAGLLLSGFFFVIFLISSFSVYMGNWQSVFLIWMMTLPFSLMCHELLGWLQASFGFSNEARAWFELALLGAVGVVEFYLIGFWGWRGWRKI